MNNSKTRFACEISPFLARLVQLHPGWLKELEAEQRLQTNDPPSPMVLNDLVEAKGLDRGLRQFRQREMMRITWRELNREATLVQTLADLSTLAELCLESALDHHQNALIERFGQPRDSKGEPQGLTVLGLGKLGGRELNLSSDIDLIFCYRESGECDGRRSLSVEQFFTRLVRAMIKSLADVTEDGFCFRVDARLRPFGDAGPLVCSVGALEQYYQREGRDWERYAMLKARPVAGDRLTGADILNTLQPFIYRRYIDYGAVESLREMLDAIQADAAKKGREDDVKRGQGGIREVEFLVQCVQLLRGGREPALRTQSLLSALDSMETLQLLPADRTRQLRENYQFLRHTENAIQALHDQQTHTVPDGSDGLRVAEAMGFKSGEAFHAALDITRQQVTTALNDSFPRQQNAIEAGVTHWRPLLQQQAGPKEASDFFQTLERNTLSQRGAERLEQFMPLLLDAVISSTANSADIKQAPLQDALRLTLTISRRSAYLALLVQNPAALQRLITLFSQSHWVAETVIRYPALLDELIDPALGLNIPDRDDLHQLTARVMRRQGDPETAMNAINYVKRAQSLRVAAAELSGSIDSRAAEHHLTVLAEVLMASCLKVSRQGIVERHGRLSSEGLAVIGYGSLGGGDMSYRSDLDLVFLYPNGRDESNGERPLAAETYYTRWVRRLLALATLASPAGRLYEVDTRLRPNGRSGLLVSTAPAFENYQLERAWVWELQALTRARFVAGDPDTGKTFTRVRHAALTRPRPDIDWRGEIVAMRQKIRDSRTGGDPFKNMPGGLVDIDFVAQMGILESAPAHPQITQAVSTREQLALLGAIGWLTINDAKQLSATHEQLTGARHLHSLSRDKRENPPDTGPVQAITSRFGL